MIKGLSVLAAMLSLGMSSKSNIIPPPAYRGYKTRGQFWDKLERNRNKLNLSSAQRDTLATLGGRAKKNFLKELRS